MYGTYIVRPSPSTFVTWLLPAPRDPASALSTTACCTKARSAVLSTRSALLVTCFSPLMRPYSPRAAAHDVPGDGAEEGDEREVPPGAREVDSGERRDGAGDGGAGAGAVNSSGASSSMPGAVTTAVNLFLPGDDVAVTTACCTSFRNVDWSTRDTTGESETAFMRSYVASAAWSGRRDGDDDDDDDDGDAVGNGDCAEGMRGVSVSPVVVPVAVDVLFWCQASDPLLTIAFCRSKRNVACFTRTPASLMLSSTAERRVPLFPFARWYARNERAIVGSSDAIWRVALSTGPPSFFPISPCSRLDMQMDLND